MPHGPGIIQQKVILLLFAGIALGLSGSPRTSFRVLKAARGAWKEIERTALRRAIKGLYRSKLIREERNKDGSVTIILTNAGHERALTYKLDDLTIKRPASWDGKWRVVIFDVPERIRRLRDTLRHRLKQLGFHELQKSVFVFPFECQDEIDYVIELHRARRYVRYIVAELVDNALHLKEIFRLS